jgi:hypothetical protein
MGSCIRQRLSTRKDMEKGEIGKRKRILRLSTLRSRFPFPILLLPYSPLFPIRSLVLLNVVSMNPRTRLRAIASFKQDILFVLASQKVYTGVDILF